MCWLTAPVCVHISYIILPVTTVTSRRSERRWGALVLEALSVRFPDEHRKGTEVRNGSCNASMYSCTQSCTGSKSGRLSIKSSQWAAEAQVVEHLSTDYRVGGLPPHESPLARHWTPICSGCLSPCLATRRDWWWLESVCEWVKCFVELHLKSVINSTPLSCLHIC